MRKEYTPAIILYAVSALLYIAAAYCAMTNNYHWATVGAFGIVVMLFASSRLVAIGRSLREKEKSEREKDGSSENGEQ